MRFLRVLPAILLFALLFPLPSYARKDAGGSPFRIIPRSAWGADESLGLVQETPPETSDETTTPSESQESSKTRMLSEREKECRALLRKYPKEFRTKDLTTHAPTGEAFRWPRTYSPVVKLLIIHHTGENNHAEEGGVEVARLTGEERVRGIYRAHTVGNGWGDIGYHYLIDPEGIIYEGKAGGRGVIGAHVYCANTGTIGIAMLGNFTREDPEEAQLQSLRYLLARLSEEYGIDPRGTTLFHGQRVPTILAHRDISLNATACAGDIVETLLPRVRRLTAAKDFTMSMLPKKQELALAVSPSKGEESPRISIRGSPSLTLPPRGVVRFEVIFQYAGESLARGARIADVERSSTAIGLWQERSGEKFRVRDSLVAPYALAKDDPLPITLTVLAPHNAGTYHLKLGDLALTLDVAGRRSRVER